MNHAGVHRSVRKQPRETHPERARALHLGQQVRGLSCNAFQNERGLPVQIRVLCAERERGEIRVISAVINEH